MWRFPQKISYDYKTSGEIFAEEVEGGEGGFFLDLGAGAVEEAFEGYHALAGGDSKTHQAHGLLLRAAGRSGDARN